MIRAVSLLLCPLMCTVALAADRSTPKNADETYVAAECKARLGLNPTGATTDKLDIERIRRVAVDPDVTRFRAFAWELLGSIKEPSQLDFLLGLIGNAGDKPGWPNLANAIRKQVRTPEDEKKLLPFLKDEKLFPYLVQSLVRTRDQEMLNMVFAEKNADNNVLGAQVFSFILDRRSLGLTVEPKDAEKFLRAWTVRKRKGVFLPATEAILAGELGYLWSVELLAAMLEWRLPDDVPDGNNREGRRWIIEGKTAAVTAMQKITGQDFGANGADMTMDQLEAACAKANAWWAKNSKDARYRLQPEEKSPAHPMPAPAGVK